MDDDEPLHRHLVEVAQRRDRAAGLVHVRLRLGQDHGPAVGPGRPEGRPRPGPPGPRCALNLAPSRAASRSTTMKPTLCRLAAYAGPGLPRPTTSHRRRRCRPRTRPCGPSPARERPVSPRRTGRQARRPRPRRLRPRRPRPRPPAPPRRSGPPRSGRSWSGSATSVVPSGRCRSPACTTAPTSSPSTRDDLGAGCGWPRPRARGRGSRARPARRRSGRGRPTGTSTVTFSPLRTMTRSTCSTPA